MMALNTTKMRGMEMEITNSKELVVSYEEYMKRTRAMNVVFEKDRKEIQHKKKGNER